MNKLAALPFYKRGGYWAAARANADPQMCDQCVELDKKIEHYEKIAGSISDRLTLDRIKQLVEQMKAIKAALHPEQNRG
jgi:hypothetical protein